MTKTYKLTLVVDVVGTYERDFAEAEADMKRRAYVGTRCTGGDFRFDVTQRPEVSVTQVGP